MGAKDSRTTGDKHHQEKSESLGELRTRLETESGGSLKLLKDLKENPICSIRYDESVPCLIVTWKQHATRAQVRFIHESILRLLKQHRVSKILGDDTALPTIHAADRAWLVENWMPRALAAGLKFTASKNPDAHFGKVSVCDVLSGAPEGLVARSLETLDDAKRWLKGVGAS